MRRLRICLYGGTDLKGAPPQFIASLAYQILSSMNAIIITGGFKYSRKSPSARSTDSAALNGARRYAQEHQKDLKDCYEAWIPEPELDRRPDIGNVVRMREHEEGITVRTLAGHTPLGRRLAMVADVDMVVTISGSRHTEVIVEQALELGIPVLPIPFAGGDSKATFEAHRGRIAARFDAAEFERCLNTLERKMTSAPDEGARAVVELLCKAKVGKCLVLLPYDKKHNRLYKSSIEPAVERHMVADRLDHRPRSDAIYTSFAEAVRSSSAVIADITSLNENVMYEVGYIHASGLKPLIFTREAARLESLPVYFRTLNVKLASRTTPIGDLVEVYLRSVKDARGFPKQSR